MASASVTQPPTLGPENYPMLITFNFNYSKANCTTKVQSNYTEFSTYIQSEVVKIANIDVNVIAEFNITCASIVVNMKLVQSGIFTVNDSLTRIRNAIIGGKMIIMIDNVKVVADKDSFESHVDPQYVTTPTPDEEDDDDDDLSKGAIIGIVIGVLALLLIVIILVYCCCIKKNGRKQGTVEPNDQELELKGM